MLCLRLNTYECSDCQQQIVKFVSKQQSAFLLYNGTKLTHCCSSLIVVKLGHYCCFSLIYFIFSALF